MFAMVFKFFQAFLQVFQTLVSSVLFIFFCMLQLLHLNVSKIDWVLHMGCVWEAAGDADDVRAAWAHCWCAPSRARLALRSFTPSAWQRPDASVPYVRPGASKSTRRNSRITHNDSSSFHTPLPYPLRYPIFAQSEGPPLRLSCDRLDFRGLHTYCTNMPGPHVQLTCSDTLCTTVDAFPPCRRKRPPEQVKTNISFNKFRRLEMYFQSSYIQATPLNKLASHNYN
jgi:hypothetical protein